jgi:hypothetical protein
VHGLSALLDDLPGRCDHGLSRDGTAERTGCRDSVRKKKMKFKTEATALYIFLLAQHSRGWRL